MERQGEDAVVAAARTRRRSWLLPRHLTRLWLVTLQPASVMVGSGRRGRVAVRRPSLPPQFPPPLPPARPLPLPLRGHQPPLCLPLFVVGHGGQRSGLLYWRSRGRNHRPRRPPHPPPPPPPHPRPLHRLVGIEVAAAAVVVVLVMRLGSRLQWRWREAHTYPAGVGLELRRLLPRTGRRGAMRKGELGL